MTAPAALTPRLRLARDAAAEIAVAGYHPGPARLAARLGGTHRAARRAIYTLRRLGLWPHDAADPGFPTDAELAAIAAALAALRAARPPDDAAELAVHLGGGARSPRRLVVRPPGTGRGFLDLAVPTRHAGCQGPSRGEG